MKLLKEFLNYDNTVSKIMKVARSWAFSNLIIEKHIQDFISGLAYTSSSDFAGLWECNTNSKYKWDIHFHFECFAVSEDGFIVAHFVEYDDDNNEIFNDGMNIIIGRL